jgi:alpha-beta hydrolase superfamily lysophospholipase
MAFQKLFFESTTGEKLAAHLDLPSDREAMAYALFAHCFTCNKNYKATANISRTLAREGIGVLRFDFTGLGESEGDFADTDFSSNVADLVAAADFLKNEYEAPKILIGHSLGGAAVLQAAARIPSSVAVVTIAAPAEPTYVLRALGRTKERIEARGEAEVTIGGRTFKIKKQFLDDLEQTHMQETIRQLNRALLVFHSARDDVVGIDNADQIFEAAGHPKGFISLDQADHLLSNQDDSLYVASLIAVWARKYIQKP